MTLIERIAELNAQAEANPDEFEPVSADMPLWHELGVHTAEDLDAYIEPMPGFK